MRGTAALLFCALASLCQGADPASHFVSLDGIKIHYESYGGSGSNTQAGGTRTTGTQTSGTQNPGALVFIHGWTCDLTFWRGQEPVYTTHRSLLIDLPGHGLSDKPHRSYPMEYFARAVEAVMRDAGVSRGVLVGHSLGGPIAYAFLRQFPQEASAMVLVDAEVRPGSAGPIHPDQQKIQMAARARAMSGPAGDRNFAKSVEEMFSDKTPEPVRQEIRSRMLATPKWVRVAAVTSPSSLPPPGKDETFPIPAIAIQAASNGTEARFAIMKTLFPSMRLEMWEGNGHFLMREEPERFNHELEAFLATLK
jgi:pimeloyl-ACP methyl ester carboxylesterase